MNLSFKKRLIQVILGISISGFFIYLAFRNVDLSIIIASLSGVKIAYLFLSMVMITANFAIRSVRWHILLKNEMNVKVSLPEYFKAILVGQLANSLLPFRMGDVVQVSFFSYRNRGSVGLVFSTVVLKRVVDLLAVSAIVAISSFAVFMPKEINTNRAYLFIIAICVALIAMFILKRKIFALLLRLVKSENMRSKLEGFIERFCYGLDMIKDKQKLTGMVLLTAVLWCGYSLALYLCMLGFDIRIGYPGVIVVLGITSMSFLVPFTIASLGVWEVFSIIGLSIFGIPKSLALSYAIAYHFISLVVLLAFGSFFLVQSGLSIQKIEGFYSSLAKPADKNS